MEIRIDDLQGGAIKALLQEHLDVMHEHSPLGSVRTGRPRAATHWPRSVMRRGSQGADCSSKNASHASATPRDSAMSSQSARIASAAARRSASSGERTSTVKFTPPGITLMAPSPSTASLPTVPTIRSARAQQ